MTGFAQDDAGVDVHLAEGDPLRTTYLVGADGGRSVVRKAAGIEFVGWEATRSHLIAEVEVTEEPPHGHPLRRRRDPRAERDGGRADRGGRRDRAAARTGDRATLADLARGADGPCTARTSGSTAPTWISRFTDATRQAAAYRAGRVLLAGDAAHIHPPTGGQGIGLGVQDAVNLGWKLAQVVTGHLARRPPGHLPRRAAPGRRPGPEATRWRRPSLQRATRESRRCATRSPSCWPSTGRAAARGAPVRARRRLRPRRGAPVARTPHARPRPGHSRGPRRVFSCCTGPGRCCSTSASRGASTSRGGPTGSSWSTPTTTGPGSCP